MKYNKKSIKSLLRKIAQNGTAPNYGCELFGTGYEDAYSRLLEEIIEGTLADGDSTEKFIVGPYGSGKTHFLRQFCSMAEDRGCVTSEASLTKDVDYTNGLVVYNEFSSQIKPPGKSETGIKELLKASLENAQIIFTESDQIDGWIETLEDHQYAHDQFGRVLGRALRSIYENDKETVVPLCRWLQGEVHNRELIRSLPDGLFLQPVPKPEQGLKASQLMRSLGQFIRLSNFKGTVICFDEAEQGLSVSAKKEQIIQSLLLSQINAINDLENGSLLILYAFTNDLESRFMNLPALAQRISTPAGHCFFRDNNTNAAVINLTLNATEEEDLSSMGHKLCDLFYEYFGDNPGLPIDDAKTRITKLAEDAFLTSASVSNRRELMRNTALYLLSLLPEERPAPQQPDQEDEV